jgi:hypothetical protein
MNEVQKASDCEEVVFLYVTPCSLVEVTELSGKLPGVMSQNIRSNHNRRQESPYPITGICTAVEYVFTYKLESWFLRE